MKRVLLACVSIVALGGVATAADLRRPPPPTKAPPPVYPAGYNWTGFYLGVNGGYAFGTSQWDSTDEFDLTGAVVGGTIGYNWQNGPLVFGLEADADWTNIKGDTTTNCAPAGCETKNNWLATVRGRIGPAFGRVLPYATGGLAVGDIKARTGGVEVADETKAGWTAGGGIELALTGNWTAKAEYLYVDLGKFNCGAACGVADSDNVSFKTNIVRGGFNFRF